MPVFNPNKTVSRSQLACGGTTDVTLSFEASPQLSTLPADMVLIMDRSGSMAGAPLDRAREAARQFIRTVARASGDPGGQNIGNGSRLGLVSFADIAREDVPLSTDTAALDAAVEALTGGGSTNHREAFETAQTMLEGSTAPRRVAVMFTDGGTTAGGDPAPVAEAMKGRGIEIFCIGLGADPALLEGWATDPDRIHVASADRVDQLEQVFAQAAAEVVRAGALDAFLAETLAPGFKLVRVLEASHGSVDVLDGQHLEWRAGAVGAAGPETAVLTFEAVHIGTAGGRQPVNASVRYTDREGTALNFPAPEVEVDCGGPAVYPEPCPLPTTFRVESCQDAAAVEAGDALPGGPGRIVRVDATVRSVCPGRRVAAAVLLTELGADGVEHTRGLKTFLIPAQTGTGCRDLRLRCIPFVVPEALDVEGSPDAICGPRDFRVRVLANYVDSGFTCCDPRTVIL